jgi:hypothetical protein
MAAAAAEVDGLFRPQIFGNLGQSYEILALRMDGAFDIGAGARAELVGDIGIVGGFHRFLL